MLVCVFCGHLCVHAAQVTQLAKEFAEKNFCSLLWMSPQ